VWRPRSSRAACIGDARHARLWAGHPRRALSFPRKRESRGMLHLLLDSRSRKAGTFTQPAYTWLRARRDDMLER
jgi:hypothetical protein